MMLIGNVGADPEVRYYGPDQSVANVRLATKERGYDLPNGTRVPDRTDWHNLVFYRRLAKVVEAYVHKGDKLYVEGKLQYRKYTNRRGIELTSVDVVVDSMEMLTAKSASGSGASQQQTAQQPASSASEATAQTAGQTQQQEPPTINDNPFGGSETANELPF